MGKFMHPGSVRYGTLLDWAKLSETSRGYFKIKGFEEYLERVITDRLGLQDGIVINKISIEGDTRYSKVNISIELYDRLLELSLREGSKAETDLVRSEEMVVERLLGDKLLVLKRLIISEGFKYFQKKVDVEFIFVKMVGLKAIGLSRFVSYNLERGYSIVEILRLIAREFKGTSNVVGEDEIGSLDLSHRNRRVFTEDVRSFKKVLISGRYLLGYRVDVAGRYSRKQRASKQSFCEGTVPFGSFKGNMDYGMSEALMQYGLSSVRVWFYYDRNVVVNSVEENYLCRVR